MNKMNKGSIIESWIKTAIVLAFICMLSTNVLSVEEQSKSEEIYKMIYNMGHQKYNEKIKSSYQFKTELLKFDHVTLVPIMIECLEADTFFVESTRYNESLNKEFKRGMRLTAHEILAEAGAVNTQEGLSYYKKALYDQRQVPQGIIQAFEKVDAQHAPDVALLIADYLKKNYLNDTTIISGYELQMIRTLGRLGEKASTQKDVLYLISMDTLADVKLWNEAIISLYNVVTLTEYLNFYDSLNTDQQISTYLNTIILFRNGIEEICTSNLIPEYYNIALKALKRNPRLINYFYTFMDDVEDSEYENYKVILNSWYDFLSENKELLSDSLKNIATDSLNLLRTRIDNY